MPDDTPVPENSFVTLVKSLRGGDCFLELDRALRQLVGDVRSIGKAGELTLKIAIAPSGTISLIVKDAITVKEPKLDQESTVMFADDHNRVTRRDPRQPALPTMERPRVTPETGDAR